MSFLRVFLYLMTSSVVFTTYNYQPSISSHSDWPSCLLLGRKPITYSNMSVGDSYYTKLHQRFDSAINGTSMFDILLYRSDIASMSLSALIRPSKRTNPGDSVCYLYSQASLINIGLHEYICTHPVDVSVRNLTFIYSPVSKWNNRHR